MRNGSTWMDKREQFNCQLIINCFSNFEIITYISYNHFNFQILIVYII